ncbi:MAG: hypothetical protein R3C68_19525, partial [Myxococcota bacterium]
MIFRARNALVVGAILGVLLSLSCATIEQASAPPKFDNSAGVFVPPKVLVASGDDELQPSLAATGGRLVYAASSAGNLDIFLRDVDGSAVRRLTSHSTNDMDPTFSPDGKHIAWVAQYQDVKGDIWVMDADGKNKRRLTNRLGAERAPAWSGDGKRIFFGSRTTGDAHERVDVLDLTTGERQVAVDNGWDPATEPSGQILFYVALDAAQRPRIYAKRLRDQKIVAVTAGGFVEGMPATAMTDHTLQVIFTRFVDDESGDGKADARDPSSLWIVEFSDARFAGADAAT